MRRLRPRQARRGAGTGLASSAANGDVHRAITQGAYSIADVAGELGDVLDGTRPGRLSERDITIAKLVGIGAQDLVAAERALALL